MGIAGESGSGKSVTALSLMQLLPKSAKIQTDSLTLFPNTDKEISLNELRPSQLNGIRGKVAGMIFQEPMSSLNPVMPCGEQVAEALFQHTNLSKSAVREKVLHLFERVQLKDSERIFSAFPHQLSGGQKQRVMIALAISTEPDILIADEPTTALDVTVQKSVLDLIKSLQEETGMSVIFISHDLNVLRHLTHRIIVMQQGKIVECKNTEDLFEYAEQDYTKSLLSAKPPLYIKLKRLPELIDFQEKKVSLAHYKPIEIEERLQHLESVPELIRVDNLSVHFKKSSGLFHSNKEVIKAVNKVSFHIKKGETLGLVGESGSGKTTIGRAMLQLLPYQQGDIYYQGKTLTEKSIKTYRKDLQIVFQNPYSSLNPRMSVGKAILEPMQFYKLHKNDKGRKAKIYELLETVGLEVEHYHRLPHEFSGGQRQRICIARALASEPRFIILDEAVSALDVSVQARILNLLIDLRERYDLTYLFISHDLAVVRFISDHVAVLNKGKIIEYNDVESIFNAPQEAYTKQLLQALV